MATDKDIKQAILRDVQESSPNTARAEARARDRVTAIRTRRGRFLPFAVAAAVFVVAAGITSALVWSKPRSEPAAAGRAATGSDVTGTWQVISYTISERTRTPNPDYPLRLTLEAPTNDGAIAVVTNTCTPSTAQWKLDGATLSLIDGWATPAIPCPPGSPDFDTVIAPGFLDLSNSWVSGADISLSASGSDMTLTTSTGTAKFSRVTPATGTTS
ncbi:hypothetical protein GIS00_15985 [Nakamurella sp. YIM 132087]|uniref:META domain-containing protein n=1 Tax=Nakamurella alba TaxID=2665158 RepID=A0A7K1FMU4_9ACTN|nr:hypothetical protein [Nakamurella alba]MTD15438.1 hypothetical protein [Nakamurella alba]